MSNDKDNKEEKPDDIVCTFELSRKQYNEAQEFCKKHNELHKGQYTGAIGGRYTYTFTSTSIGTIAGVKCSCGDSVCVTGLEDM